ncbi:hypothetical protein SGRIM128S_01570 [Streptomyces griseomycini]
MPNVRFVREEESVCRVTTPIVRLRPEDSARAALFLR